MGFRHQIHQRRASDVGPTSTSETTPNLPTQPLGPHLLRSIWLQALAFSDGPRRVRRPSKGLGECFLACWRDTEGQDFPSDALRPSCLSLEFRCRHASKEHMAPVSITSDVPDLMDLWDQGSQLRRSRAIEAAEQRCRRGFRAVDHVRAPGTWPERSRMPSQAHRNGIEIA